MIRNYLLITWRSMMKNKLFIFINIFGLAIGIACSIVAYFNYEYDATFDTHHKNYDNIYRVGMVKDFEGSSILYGIVPTPLGRVIGQNLQEGEKVARLDGSWSNFKVGDDLFPINLAYADPELFEIFSFEFISGSPTGLKDKSTIFISDETALKLFNSTDVVGKQITQVMGGKTKEVQVGGVFKKQPANSSLDKAAYLNYENYFDEFTKEREDSWKDRNAVYMLIPEKSRVQAITQQMQPYKENNNKVREDFIVSAFVLDPLDGLARRDSDLDTPAVTNRASPPAAVLAPTLMALFVLLIACFNMTNTAIAISSRRLKEIGIRKVMGSMRSQLIWQFLGETTFICAIALVLGLFLGELLLGSWNSLWPEMKLTSHYLDNPAFLIFIIGTLAFTALVAGGYPAFYISHFEPVSILKGNARFGGTNAFTRTLLVLQYMISLVAIIFAIAFYGNSVFQRNFDIGYNDDGVIIAYVDNLGEYETYRNALLESKDIRQIAGSEHSINSAGYNDPIKFESKQMEVDIINVGDDYLKAMELSLKEGRDFQKDSETDRKESIIVSEKLVKDFGWINPIGKEVIWMDTVKLYVIGVIKNVYTNGLWREMDPLMIRYTTQDKYTHVIVNGPTEKLTEINAFMEKQWKQIFPNRLYNGRYLNDESVEAANVNNNIVKMFLFLGIVAMILSATGLFTLVSLNIIKRMKEIGVRKVLGASIGNITRIINTQFVVMLTIASVGGCVLSMFAVDALMDSIWDYYQKTTFATFAISVSLLFVISGLAIGFKVFRAASMNPVSTLRTE